MNHLRFSGYQFSVLSQGWAFHARHPLCASLKWITSEFLCSDCAELDDYLEKIQCLLFSVCSAVATPLTTSSQYVLKKIHFDEAHVKNLEKWSALIYSQLPPQDSFYLPVLLVHSRDI